MHTKSAMYFKAHESIKELFYTSDGQHFKTQSAADAHAIDLKRKDKDDTVTQVTRKEVEEAGEKQPTGEQGGGNIGLTGPQKMQLGKLKKKLEGLQAALDGSTDASDEAKQKAVAAVAEVKQSILAIDPKAFDEAPAE